MMTTNISLRLGIDRNQDRKIDRDELIGLEELNSLDTSGDKFLKGYELDPVYYEYGKDKWLQAGRSHRLPSERTVTIVNLHSIGLDPTKIEMDIKVQLHA